MITSCCIEINIRVAFDSHPFYVGSYHLRNTDSYANSRSTPGGADPYQCNSAQCPPVFSEPVCQSFSQYPGSSHHFVSA